MAQRKETKKTIKVRDLKPKKDAKGGCQSQHTACRRTGATPKGRAADITSTSASKENEPAPRFDPACGFVSVILFLIKK